MRSVAVMLLIVSGLSAVTASTDRVAEAHAVRSNPRRLLLVSIASPCRPSPPSPSRRHDSNESALDPEETSDLDPLDSPPVAVAVEPMGSPDAGPFSIVPAFSSGAGRTRSRLLRC